MYNVSLIGIVTMNLPLYNEYSLIKIYFKKRRGKERGKKDRKKENKEKERKKGKKERKEGERKRKEGRKKERRKKKRVLGMVVHTIISALGRWEDYKFKNSVGYTERPVSKTKQEREK
jgi:hypothetical protein